jgi:hypothetical protein
MEENLCVARKMQTDARMKNLQPSSPFCHLISRVKTDEYMKTDE